jgi:hypothetical protein
LDFCSSTSLTAPGDVTLFLRLVSHLKTQMQQKPDAAKSALNGMIEALQIEVTL